MSEKSEDTRTADPGGLREGDAGECPTCHDRTCIGRLQYEDCVRALTPEATAPDADPGGLRERIEALPVCKVAMSSDPKWPDPHLHRKDVLAAITPEATAPDTRET